MISNPSRANPGVPDAGFWPSAQTPLDLQWVSVGGAKWLVIATLTVVVGLARGADPQWKKIAPLPDAEGLAGAFSGVSGGRLLVAGGANFPRGKPWEGGTKVWCDTIYALDRPDGKWMAIGTLPRPLGYGVSVSDATGVVCVGGSDAERHYRDAFRLSVVAGQLKLTSLPSLPRTIANACGAIAGNIVYVAGGHEQPDAARTLKGFWALDLGMRDPAWRELEGCPGPGRMLAVAAAANGTFWLISGADLALGESGKPERRYLRDAWRHDVGTGWRRLADLPHPVVAAPSPAPMSESGPLVLGGDDGTQVGRPPQWHRGFSRRILRYEQAADRWTAAGGLPAGRVTVPAVPWMNAWVIPGGEVRPGVRSPEVWMVEFPD